MVTVTFYGGVSEIGGNKILLQDRDTKIFLDFGKSFRVWTRFFGGFLNPRSVNGIGDFIATGLLPPIPGIYREDLVRLAGDLNIVKHLLKRDKPDIDAVFISHAHSDHADYISFLHPSIPIYCGETARLIFEALHEGRRVDIESEILRYRSRSYKREESGGEVVNRVVRTFRTGVKRIKIGSIEVEPIHVDHSIPGAYGFIIDTSAGALVYTGDLRKHGKRAEMTQDFVDRASESDPIALIIEGTKIGEVDRTGEEEVRSKSVAVAKDSRGIVFADFNFKDVDRLQTFLEVASETDRRLVIPLRHAFLLKYLQKDRELKNRIPDPRDERIALYKDKRRTGRYHKSDYDVKERQFLDQNNVLTAKDIREIQNRVIMVLGSYDFNELVDISPEDEGIYIHSLSEPFNEEMGLEADRIRNWLNFFNLKYFQNHCHGHADYLELKEIIEEVSPKKIYPIHTEYPELFTRFSDQSRSVQVVEEGEKINI